MVEAVLCIVSSVVSSSLVVPTTVVATGSRVDFMFCVVGSISSVVIVESVDLATSAVVCIVVGAVLVDDVLILSMVAAFSVGVLILTSTVVVIISSGVVASVNVSGPVVATVYVASVVVGMVLDVSVISSEKFAVLV